MRIRKASFSIFIVENNTSTENRKVQIGSTIFHSGYNKKTIHDEIITNLNNMLNKMVFVISNSIRTK